MQRRVLFVESLDAFLFNNKQHRLGTRDQKTLRRKILPPEVVSARPVRRTLFQTSAAAAEVLTA
ncbi:MAG: hypothetical protein E3J73_01080 [Candidatus Bathyarchaeum sp.]|nr:MAG: hypothetical protein E3J73_01080 [Candidatus Bathyarchaeum sp.]